MPQGHLLCQSWKWITQVCFSAHFHPISSCTQVYLLRQCVQSQCLLSSSGTLLVQTHAVFNRQISLCVEIWWIFKIDGNVNDDFYCYVDWQTRIISLRDAAWYSIQTCVSSLICSTQRRVNKPILQSTPSPVSWNMHDLPSGFNLFWIGFHSSTSALSQVNPKSHDCCHAQLQFCCLLLFCALTESQTLQHYSVPIILISQFRKIICLESFHSIVILLCIFRRFILTL